MDIKKTGVLGFIALFVSIILLNACQARKEPLSTPISTPVPEQATAFVLNTLTPTNPPPPTTTPTATPRLFDTQLQRNSLLGVRWGRRESYADYVDLGVGHAPVLIGHASYPDQIIYIVDAQTGREIWTYHVPAENELHYVTIGKTLVIGEADRDGQRKSSIHAYELPGMKELWQIEGMSNRIDALVGGPGWLLLGESADINNDQPTRLYRLDLADGHLLWAAEGQDGCYGFYAYDLLVFEKMVRLGCYEFGLYFDLDDGTLIGRQDAGDSTLGGTYAGAGVMYHLRESREKQLLEALDLADVSNPRTLWSEAVSPGVYDIQVYAGDVIYRDRNLVTRRQQESGKIVWQTEVSGFVASSLIVVGKRVLVGSEVGYFHILDADTGELIWEQDIWGSIEPRFITIDPIAMVADGLIVHAGGSFAGSMTLFLSFNVKTAWPIPFPLPTNIPVPTETSTPMPVFTPPAHGELSEAPQLVEDWPAAMVTFLNANPGNLAFFDDLLSKWSHTATDLEVETEWKQVDLTGDGRKDLLVLIKPVSPIMLDGMVIVLCQDADRRYQPVYVRLAVDPVLEAVADLDQDGQLELVYSEKELGVTALGVYVNPLKWDGQAFVDMIEEPIETTSVEPDIEYVWVKNVTGDGKIEIQLFGGTNGSAAAGPTRNYTFTYALVDGKYQLVTKKPDSAYKYFFVIVDAHTLLMEGDLDGAISAFQDALTAPDALRKAEQEPWKEGLHHMQAFAEYQLMLAYLMKGDENSAATWAASGHYPQALYSQIKTLFWETYQADHDWVAAAEVARTRARLVGHDAIQLIPYLGYANDDMGLEDVCPCAECRQGYIGAP